jgi:hypothetical protein
MSTTLRRFAFLVVLLVATTRTLPAAVRGYVEFPYTPTICQQESHFLTDPCTGALALADDDQGIDLDPYVCTYVVVDGPDIGVECEVIATFSVTPAQPPCPIMFSGLWLSATTPPQVNWFHVTCAVSHDVIRGGLQSLAAGTTSIDLGPVRCLADDVPQADFWYVAGPVDSDLPPSGEAFFYTARAAGLPEGDATYGRSSDGRERIPSSGDCPL